MDGQKHRLVVKINIVPAVQHYGQANGVIIRPVRLEGFADDFRQWRLSDTFDQNVT